MKSVPPRGSGWVKPLPIFQLPIANCPISYTSIGNKQSTIGNAWTLPLLRGGTDFMLELIEHLLEKEQS
jgi:hypothetical protein